MKQTLTLLPILFLGFIGSSQDITARNIQKNLVEVRGNLYVWPYEVSNGLYNEFLADLKAQGIEGYGTHAVKAEGWESVLTYSKPYVEYYHSHEAYADYPVVNITQGDAERFCTWLTVKYNQDEKRKFNEVVFRLPTLQEWEHIASGGEDIIYPWGHSYITDGKGQFMLNCTVLYTECLKSLEDGCYKMDSLCLRKRRVSANPGEIGEQTILMAPVKSFVPSKNGLYNLAGNVAEMVAEGVAKGGSWKSYPYYCQIWAEPEYANFQQPSPLVGFRFVMEVVDP